MAPYVVADGPDPLLCSNLDFAVPSKEYDLSPRLKSAGFSPMAASSGSESGSPRSVLPVRPSTVGRKSSSYNSSRSPSSRGSPAHIRQLDRASATGSLSRAGGYGKYAATLAASLEAAEQRSSLRAATTPPTRSRSHSLERETKETEAPRLAGGAELASSTPYDQMMQKMRTEKNLPDYSAQFAEAQKQRRQGRTAPIVPFSDGFGCRAWEKEAEQSPAQPAPSKAAKEEQWTVIKVRGAEGVDSPTKASPRRGASGTIKASRSRPRTGGPHASASPLTPVTKAKSSSRGFFACFGGPN